MSNTIPENWLLCNGQTFNKELYPELYKILNKNTTPDLRESTLKGTGLTSCSNNHYNDTGIALGEFIEDRIQDHTHFVDGARSGLIWIGSNNGKWTNAGGNFELDGFTISNIDSGRSGETTEVKSVGVNYIIKAK